MGKTKDKADRHLVVFLITQEMDDTINRLAKQFMANRSVVVRQALMIGLPVLANSKHFTETKSGCVDACSLVEHKA